MTKTMRVRGGMLGLLVGDALGVPYEFRPPDQIPARAKIEYRPPDGSPTHRVLPGTYSDDGAQAIALLDSLLAHGEYDQADFERRLVSWYSRGEYAAGRDVFDVGIQTRAAIRSIENGNPDRGVAGESGNGNGSLMRVLPLALWHDGDDESLIRDACLSSVATHPHIRSQLCCATYCLWARAAIEGRPDPWIHAAQVITDSAYVADRPDMARELERNIRPFASDGGSGTGYVVDCLHSARWAVRVGTDYASTVRAAISLGNDTDTTAAVAGGIAGILYGSASIPDRWKRGLRGGEWWKSPLARLEDRVTSRAARLDRGPHTVA